MKLKLISVLALSAFAVSAAAQDEGFKITGDVATSIFFEDGKGGNQGTPGTNLGFPAGGAMGGVTGAENDNDFSLDLVEVNIEKNVGNSGVFLGIGFGRIFGLTNNTGDSNTGDPKTSLNITQAYFHHKVGDTGLSFKLGKFEAGIGHESYNFMDNMNYTRSYAFNYMNPFYFTGLGVDYTINEMFNVGVVLANTTANSDVDENRQKIAGVNLVAKPIEGLNVKLNYLVGKEGPVVLAGTSEADSQRINATVDYMFGGMWNVAAHYTSYTSEDVVGGAEREMDSIALYAGAKMETWGAGLRYEMVNDDDLALTFRGLGATAGGALVAGGTTDNDYSIITATGWYNADQNATIKLEIAQHNSDAQVFTDNDGNAEDGFMTYGLGFLYRF